jgi:hypothetical protein
VYYCVHDCSVKATIERYKKATSSDNSNSSAGTVAEVTIQVTSCGSVNTQYMAGDPG